MYLKFLTIMILVFNTLFFAIIADILPLYVTIENKVIIDIIGISSYLAFNAITIYFFILRYGEFTSRYIISYNTIIIIICLLYDILFKRDGISVISYAMMWLFLINFTIYLRYFKRRTN
jgi:hypothetical protein